MASHLILAMRSMGVFEWSLEVNLLPKRSLGSTDPMLTFIFLGFCRFNLALVCIHHYGWKSMMKLAIVIHLSIPNPIGH